MSKVDFETKLVKSTEIVIDYFLFLIAFWKWERDKEKGLGQKRGRAQKGGEKGWEERDGKRRERLEKERDNKERQKEGRTNPQFTPPNLKSWIRPCQQ